MNTSSTEKKDNNNSAALSGDYQNASEVVPDKLRSEIAKGWDGPASKRRVKNIISAKAKAKKNVVPDTLR